jgi:hypothetical protein
MSDREDNMSVAVRKIIESGPDAMDLDERLARIIRLCRAFDRERHSTLLKAEAAEQLVVEFYALHDALVAGEELPRAWRRYE